MTGPAIRPATPDDLPAILAIHNEAIRHLDAIWSETEDTLADRAAWLAEREAANYPVLVAIDGDGALLGYGACGPYRSKPGYRLTAEHSIYLAAEARGRGIGRALLVALIAETRARGFHLMVGVIDAGNAASLRLHAQLGFEHAGTLREAGFKHGRWLDQVQVALRLDSAPAPTRGG